MTKCIAVHRVWVVAAALVWTAMGRAATPPEVPILAEDSSAVEAVTAAVCDKQIVMLGEAAHGNGHSDAFKAAMVTRLIERCGFRAVLFESSFPEFVPIWRTQRAGRPVTPEHVGTAVGGLWKFNREFAPLLPYLAAKANDGLFLGGIDFQLGGLDQTYTNAGMIAELSAGLAPKRAETCRNIVAARIRRGRELDAEQQQLARHCMAAIASCLVGKRGAVADEQRMMLQSLTDFLEAETIRGPGPYIAARDRTMFRNLQSLQKRLPPRTKLIVWTANAHAAKSAQGADGFAGVDNLGSYVVAAFGSRSYALGTTALGGTQRWGREIKPFPDASAGSLERAAIRPGNPASVFLDLAALQRSGKIPAHLFGLRPVSSNWSERFDGVVVFAEEHAAFNTRHGN